MNQGIAKIKKDHKTMFSNGGWNYDAYPELERLDAHTTMLIGELRGPGIVNHIHITQHWLLIPHLQPNGLTEEACKAIAARGILIEIYYDDAEQPAVRVPLGDFFGDGCGGQAEYYSNLFFEKAPDTYNCFVPMPFKQSIRIVLVNETAFSYMNYSFVEAESLPVWDEQLGYFHATWDRFAFQVSPETDQPILHLEGAGHLLGRAYSICTDEPKFTEYYFLMEGNNEFRIDGEARPTVDYLGTEDSFGFSWGFRSCFSGLRNGMNYISQPNREKRLPYRHVPCMLSIYRFSDVNPIRFAKSLDLRINWRNENHFAHEFALFQSLTEQDRLWADFATTHYWYQDLDSLGYQHAPLPALEERIKQVLRPNTVVTDESTGTLTPQV